MVAVVAVVVVELVQVAFNIPEVLEVVLVFTPEALVVQEDVVRLALRVLQELMVQVLAVAVVAQRVH
jgi:hypothetical protein